MFLPFNKMVPRSLCQELRVSAEPAGASGRRNPDTSACFSDVESLSSWRLLCPSGPVAKK